MSSIHKRLTPLTLALTESLGGRKGTELTVALDALAFFWEEEEASVKK